MLIAKKSQLVKTVEKYREGLSKWTNTKYSRNGLINFY
jgi:hypothetical protein